MEKQIVRNIPKEKFTLVQQDEKIFDAALKTKPVGYFKDAMNRFVKNKASVAAAIIILLIVIFAFIAPLLTPYKISYFDGVYAKVRPKILAFEKKGFWDGGKDMKYNDRYLIYSAAIGMAAEDPEGTGEIGWNDGLASRYSPIIGIGQEIEEGGQTYRIVRTDSYHNVGFRYVKMPMSRYEDIRKWEEETGISVIYPMIDTRSKFMAKGNEADANYWYQQAPNGAPLNSKGKRAELTEVIENGLKDNYLRKDGEVQYYRMRDKSMVDVRVLYYNYYQYVHGFEPVNHFGTDAQGYDIMIRMASGIRLSLLLAICVSAVNLTVGAFIGAMEGYYGGLIDLYTERIIEIIAGIPFIVMASLFQLHFVNPGIVSPFVGLLFAFFVTGWIGTAARVRTQFYRFKKEEYILSARTLGASDFRLMFKHIFPNAIGTIITSSVLVIPSTILSESVLSYLGIVNFQGRNITSLGTMLSNGQGYLATDPHILFFPAIVISLLMISFNLFGNGLRDAFNPSLRGAED